MITDTLKDLINTALTSINLPLVDFHLDHPVNEAHGDYAANVAMVLYPKLKEQGINDYENPHSLADAIAAKINSLSTVDRSLFTDITVAGPGFINFKLSTQYLFDQTNLILTDRWPKTLQDKNIAVEYTDPNPFKEFHIGHLYSNIIGESISRIFEACGATVWRGDFYGDVGMHIAKSVWGLMTKMQTERLTLSDLDKLPLNDRQAALGQGYALGVTKFDKDENIKKQIENINCLIYAISQQVLKEERHWHSQIDYHADIEKNSSLYETVNSLYRAGLKWSLEYFETIYKRLGTKFDGYYPESYVGELGLQAVQKGLDNAILEIGEDNSVIYKGEKDGLHTRVFRNKMGLPTYEAKDLGLVRAKYQDFKFDLSINIFGKEIDEYYKVVKRVLEQIDPELGKNQTHIVHGMVNLPTGKMSSRSGNVITAEWLLNQARDLALTLFDNDKVSGGEKMVIAEEVGQAAVKYAFLMSNIGDNITFDFSQSVSFHGNSGPYLQYTHARCSSVLLKAGINDSLPTAHCSLSTNPNPEELSLLRWLYRFSDVVGTAAAQFAPHLVCSYLYELAQRYNTFYNRHSILGSPAVTIQEPTKHFRLFLTSTTAQILKKGLFILGITAPVKM
jgi:arginyl-tRNA synthetase